MTFPDTILVCPSGTQLLVLVHAVYHYGSTHPLQLHTLEHFYKHLTYQVTQAHTPSETDGSRVC